MLIRYGYELTFKCPQPTLMVCLLDAHRDRSQELCYEIPTTTIPTIPTTTYLDSFGNTVRRFVAPPGDLTITSDAVIEDSGLPDPVKLDAGESPLEQLPNETLVFLLGSRSKPTSSPTSPGVISDQARAAGAGFRRSAISSAVI
jgi:hypothetical protein